MDYKNLTANIAKASECDAKTVQQFFDGMRTALLEHCSALDTVAIPAFGNFTPCKTNETIVIDHSSGRRMLLPPEITLNFKSSVILRKKILAAK